ncbi:MAG: ATP-binding protein, partial [Bdellovibrio sp.]|nr:ATP-binding protein [Bdellovibrio sp.]
QKILDSTYQIYVDWILGSWSKLRTPERSLAALSKRLCDTLNTRVSYDALKKGTDILSPNTVKTLLEIQEDHFSIKLLPRFDSYQKVFMPTKLKKIYPIDPFIAQVWNAIGKNIKRLFSANLPPLALDECAFHAQFYRKFDPVDVSYLYSETTQSEIDFYFKDYGFELKSGGNPTSKQKQLLKQCPHYFIVKKQELPLMAYLVGEKR